MKKKIFINLLFFTFLSSCSFATMPQLSNMAQLDLPIKFERPSEKRFKEAFKKYENKQKRRKRNKRILVGTAVGAGAAAITAMIISHNCKSKKNRKNKKNKDSSDSEKNDVNTLWGKAMQTVLIGVILPPALLLGNSLVGIGKDLASFLFGKIWLAGKDDTKIHLLALAQRIDLSLNRIKTATQELQKREPEDQFFKHYLIELKDSFDLFIKSLEKFCAILFFDIKNNHGKDEAASCLMMVDRLFFFCKKTAENFEENINKDKWEGFSEETPELITSLKRESLGLINYFSSFAKNSP